MSFYLLWPTCAIRHCKLPIWNIKDGKWLNVVCNNVCFENRLVRVLYVDTLLFSIIGPKPTVCGGTQCRWIQFSVLKFLCDSHCAISLEETEREKGLKKKLVLCSGVPRRVQSEPPSRVLFCRHVRSLLVSGWSDGMVSLCPALAHSHPEHPPPISNPISDKLLIAKPLGL